MRKKLLTFLTIIILTIALIIISPLAYSQAQSQSGDPIDGFPVVLNDSALFIIQKDVGSFTPEERARTISTRLEKVALDNSISLNQFVLEEQPDKTNIVVNNRVLITITEQDAEAARKPRIELSKNYLQIVKDAIAQHREDREIGHIIWAVINTIIATLLIVVAFFIVNFIYSKICNLIYSWREQYIPALRIQNLELISADRMTDIFISITHFLRSAIFLILIFVYIPFVLSFFPLTRPWGRKFINYLLGAIQLIWESLINYLPNLFVIAVVVVITYYIIRFLRFIFAEVENGTLSLPGFYQDWARPTFYILEFLVIALATIFVFPYLPGSNSPAFQGISVFLGILLSLGSSSAIANIVGGVILIYTRAFQLGDQVKIGDVSGDIEEKTLLVTRIRTSKNVLVTIPNSALLSSNITNYSVSARETKIPLVLSAKVTFPYNTPWRKVHDTLLKAAKVTEHILEDPYPYVLQAKLNEFYISYELNVYISPVAHTTKELDIIYSQLHQNIQDKCHEAGIEMMCSHYIALRDGNHTTIPEDYLPQDYTAQGFRVESNKSV